MRVYFYYFKNIKLMNEINIEAYAKDGTKFHNIHYLSDYDSEDLLVDEILTKFEGLSGYNLIIKVNYCIGYIHIG